MPKITRLEIKSFRGIRDLSIAVPPEGAVISGGNARGKSSVLKAITAALAGQGVGPDAIRLGADQAEILVDLDALRVRRSITEKGSSLTVKNADGSIWSKPQTRLTEIFGTAAIDALAFFLAEPKERRRMVLEALPVTVTREDLARWAPGADRLIAGISLDGHGLEVVERLRRLFYEVRTNVNKVAKAARAEADAAGNYPPAPETAMTLEAAATANTEAGQALLKLQARAMAAAEAKKGAERTREMIAAAEGEAQRHRDRARGAPTDDQVTQAVSEREAAVAEIARLQELITAAQAVAAAAGLREYELGEARNRAARAIEQADREDTRAKELRATLADVDAMEVPAADMEAARAEVEHTAALVADADAAASAALAAAEHDRLTAIAAQREADADEVDAVVKRLTTDVPQELAKRSALIPGLQVNGESITLDGVAVEQLSGAEQMRFAVDLCKRLNANAKILVCDGLERLDDDSLEAFVETATADGWQLIGTRVSSGELVIEALSPAGTVAA